MIDTPEPRPAPLSGPLAEQRRRDGPIGGETTALPHPKRTRHKRRRGALTVIAALLLSSGLLRLALVPSEAFAIGSDEPAAETAPQETVCSPEDTPTALMEALRAREERITARETQLADRMQALALAEAEIQEQLAALTEAEASLEALLTIADSAAQNDLDRLTAVYENMKPQDAAALFAQMEPAFSAGFMGRMNATAAAAIMTNLEPEQAYLISVVLAGRNATVPTE